MGVTFLIGNGFDLNLGMKTRYTDMYDSYIKSKSKSTVIENFKKDLQKEEHNHYQNWSDFEMGMAKYAENFIDENKFIECIRDFKAHMVNWLRKEQTELLDVLWDEVDINIFVDSIINFFAGLTPNVQHEIGDTLSLRNLCYCDFVSFNYTRILDELLSEVPDKAVVGTYTRFKINSEVIHIHGDLDNDVVLGVDNITQIKPSFDISQKTKQAFVKPEFNKNFDYRRVENATEVINNSVVVCAYGLSLGASDKMWVNVIKEWLLSNEQHHLVFFVFDSNTIPAFNFDLRMEKEIDLKYDLFDKMNLSDEQRETVWNRVHIPVSSNLFAGLETYDEEDFAVV